MEQIKFNDINREFIEDFIKKLPKEDKKKLKEYANQHPCSSASAMFTMVKSYIYNTYFRQTPINSRRNRTANFADIFNSLLQDDDDDDDIIEDNNEIL